MSHQNIDIGSLVRKKGYRLTPQRQIILDALCEAGGHATPDEVYRRVQRVSGSVNRATVYRTLSFLCDLGLVTSTTLTGGHLVYEISGPDPHHHLVCRICGSDQEIPHQVLAPLFAKIEAVCGFQVIGPSHLSLFGLCVNCRPAED